ncbi:unnamed protein product [Closterium sp. NIES-65]|nr:unnamed protein product [Closterium sp. NIES-65]
MAAQLLLEASQHGMMIAHPGGALAHSSGAVFASRFKHSKWGTETLANPAGNSSTSSCRCISPRRVQCLIKLLTTTRSTQWRRGGRRSEGGDFERGDSVEQLSARKFGRRAGDGGADGALLAPPSSKSPLEKAAALASGWVADLSASVAESVPRTLDQARLRVSTEVASLPDRLHRSLLPSIASLHFQRLPVLLFSSFIFLLLLYRTINCMFLAASSAVRHFLAPRHAATPESCLEQEEKKAELMARKLRQNLKKKNQSGVGNAGHATAISTAAGIAAAGSVDDGNGGGGVSEIGDDVHQSILALHMGQSGPEAGSGGGSVTHSSSHKATQDQMNATKRAGRARGAGSYRLGRNRIPIAASEEEGSRMVYDGFYGMSYNGLTDGMTLERDGVSGMVGGMGM